MGQRWAVIAAWTPRRWAIAGLSAVAIGLLVAVPTAVVPTPVFGRTIDVTWWSYPVVLASGLLGGVLAATYVRQPLPGVAGQPEQDRASTVGMLGGLVAFFAVGCPVCNKVVLLALGSAGAVSWFAPVQPVLALASVALLAFAVHSRLGGELSCPSGADIPIETADR